MTSHRARIGGLLASPDASWFRAALGGFLCFGATNFLLGVIGEWTGHDQAASVTAPMLVCLAMGGVGIGAAAAFRATGRGLRGIPTWNLAWLAVVAGVTVSLGMLTLKVGLASEPAARGPIVAVGSASSVLVALLALWILHERLSRSQVIGLAVIVSGIAVIGVPSGPRPSLAGVGFGLATLVLFGITNFLLKYAGHRGADSASAITVLWIASGACGLTAIALSILSGRGLAGIESVGLLAVAMVAGVFLALGMLAVKIAVSRGPAGPAAAVVGSNALLVALLDLAFFGHLPPPAKLVGMLAVLVGIAVLATGARNPSAASPRAVCLAEGPEDRRGRTGTTKPTPLGHE